MGLLVGFMAILLIYSDKLLAMQEACPIFLTLLFMRSSVATEHGHAVLGTILIPPLLSISSKIGQDILFIYLLITSVRFSLAAISSSAFIPSFMLYLITLKVYLSMISDILNLSESIVIVSKTNIISNNKPMSLIDI